MYIYTYWHGQGFIKDQEMTKNPRVIGGERWNSQKELSGPAVQRRKKRRLLYPHPKLSPGLAPYRLINVFLRIGITCKKVVY